MKKQILTITMCLALTATAALADGTKPTPQKVVTPTQVSKTSPAKAQAALTPEAILNGQTDPSKILTKEDARKNFEAKRAKARERRYNELGLSTEQRAKAEALNLKTQTEAVSLFTTLKTESKKLSELKAKHASFFVIWHQENVVKGSEKALKKHFLDSRAAFEAILTPAQKVKFEARKKELDKFRKEHKFGGYKGAHGPKHMGPPPEGHGPDVMGPDGPHGPTPIGPPPEKR